MRFIHITDTCHVRDSHQSCDVFLPITGTLYTGLADGKIVSISGKKIVQIGHTGDLTCSSEAQCGRPLGIRIHNNTLYVINAYKGGNNIHACYCPVRCNENTLVINTCTNSQKNVTLIRNVYYTDTAQ